MGRTSHAISVLACLLLLVTASVTGAPRADWREEETAAGATDTIVHDKQIMTTEERQAFPKIFPEFAGLVSNSMLIPGLDDGYTPQGITNLSDELLLVALYREFHVGLKAPSLFVVLNATIDEPATAPVRSNHSIVAVFQLYQQDGTKFTGHCGGAQRLFDYVWTVNDYQIFGYRLADITSAVATRASIDDTYVGKLTAAEHKYVDSKASWVSAEGNVLLVGDFYQPPLFRVPAWHEEGWVAAYYVDAAGVPVANATYEVNGQQALAPDFATFIKQDVQGLLLCGDTLALSVAFGLYNATLELHRAPFATQEPVPVAVPGGHTVKTYTVNKSKAAHVIQLPTGSEDLDVQCPLPVADSARGSGSSLVQAAVLFESASYLYRTPIRTGGGHIDDRAFRFGLPPLPPQ